MARCFGVIRRLAAAMFPDGRIPRNLPGNFRKWSISALASAFVREFDHRRKGRSMRFVRLGLAFYAAALLSGCQSVRKQPPATLEPVRIPPARDGEYAPESPRIRSSIAEEPEEARPRGPVKSIGWPRFGQERPTPKASSTAANGRQEIRSAGDLPVQQVSNPLTDRMRRLFRQSGNPESTDNCDGSPAIQLDSPGAIGEPALTPRGPASVRADYGSPQPRVTPVPDAGPAPIPRTVPGRTRVPVQPAEQGAAAEIPAEPTLVVPPEVPAAAVPPSQTPQSPAAGSSDNPLPGRPSLPPVLVEDPPMPLPQTPPAPPVPEVPPAVPAAPVFPDPPALTQPESPELPAAPAPAAKSSKSSTKTKSKSTSPRKTTTPRSTEDDAVLEERLRQSAERVRSGGQQPGTSPKAPVQSAPSDAGDGVTDPPLWPKRFGGSPPVGEPVIDPLPESATAPKPVAPPAPPAPAPVLKPAPMPAPQPAPMPQPPVAAPEAPVEAPPAIPGLPPTIDLDDEIPRPPRTPSASPSPTSFRPRAGRSI